MRINAKKRDKKKRQVIRTKKRDGINVQRVKPPSLTRAIDALIGEKERTKTKKQGASPLPIYPGPFGPRATLGRRVARAGNLRFHSQSRWVKTPLL